jgi:hypothetical protein
MLPTKNPNLIHRRLENESENKMEELSEKIK